MHRRQSRILWLAVAGSVATAFGLFWSKADLIGRGNADRLSSTRRVHSFPVPRSSPAPSTASHIVELTRLRDRSESAIVAGAAPRTPAVTPSLTEARSLLSRGNATAAAAMMTAVVSLTLKIAAPCMSLDCCSSTNILVLKSVFPTLAAPLLQRPTIQRSLRFLSRPTSIIMLVVMVWRLLRI